jgi:hypothetical protein
VHGLKAQSIENIRRALEAGRVAAERDGDQCLPGKGREKGSSARCLGELPRRKELLSSLPDGFPDTARGCLAIRLNADRPRALIFADQGRELEITRAFRKMNVFNPIPSQFGVWSGTMRTKNIPVERVIEDRVFKESHQSYFIQLADCVAFSLLKREVAPTSGIKKYGIHRMFEKNIAGVCFRPAAPKDPLGIVRK